MPCAPDGGADGDEDGDALPDGLALTETDRDADADGEADPDGLALWAAHQGRMRQQAWKVSDIHPYLLAS